jgi:hypothetical protein
MTTLFPIAPVGDPLLLVVGDPAGSAGNDFTVEGFALRSGRAPGTDPAGTGVLTFA